MNNYEELIVEIVYLSSEDIIATSYADEDFNGKDDNVGGW